MFEGLDIAVLQGYIQKLIEGALVGDPTAVIIVAGIAFILLALIFTTSGFLFAIVKRSFLFIVVALSGYYFATNFFQKVAAEGLTEQTLIFGLIGLVVVSVSLIVAIGSLFRQATGSTRRSNQSEPIDLAKEYDNDYAATHATAKPSAPGFTPTQLQQPQSYTTQALTTENLMNSLKDDRSLLAVLSYVIIAQFGVFSSRTISAPNVEIGMIFFVVFILGSLIFIKTTYHDYLKGVTHLVIASVFGIIISIGLGIFWAEFPVDILLSLGYFKTDAMVAFVTGIAVSLLMGSKN
ncbi:MAG: hypothetical protein COV47_02175 [Candidatus Diapherotrites archaeon CG11_big_fil_rev_8_21_14_0_20_37_9]|nr:MAG: hypothetical protein COV47_02175 [Candidatus Diapherotrites archaeon CG11_big_fil_rev_8_21_14_0_20_37_9]